MGIEISEDAGDQALSYFSPRTLAQPERLKEPASWIGHIPFSFWLIEHLRPECMVELGTHSGNSFCAFNQAGEMAGLEMKNFAIDHWLGDEHAGNYGTDVYDELSEYISARYPNATLIRSDFNDALSRFVEGEIDLLHIDGLHTYEAVRHDFESWLPKLSPRAIVLLHDSVVTANDFGVMKLVGELSQTYPTLNFVHSHGLAVVCVGQKIPSLVQRLLRNEVDINGIDALTAFEHLGLSIDCERQWRLVASESAPDRLGETLVSELSALAHQIHELAARGERRNAMRRAYELRNECTMRTATEATREILASGLFDLAYYSGQSGETREAYSLVQHYLQHGEKAGLKPSEKFDPVFYAAKYPDLGPWPDALLVHFVRHGLSEGRQGCA